LDLIKKDGFGHPFLLSPLLTGATCIFLFSNFLGVQKLFLLLDLTYGIQKLQKWGENPPFELFLGVLQVFCSAIFTLDGSKKFVF
jgi:hypothetical protein